MKSKIFLFTAIVFSAQSASSQGLLKVYHGASGETKVYNNANRSVIKPKLKMSQGEVLTVEVVNANTLLYNYSLKFEDIIVESEDKAITDLLSTFNTILASRSGAGAFAVKTAETDAYKNAVNLLVKDINDAKGYILASDTPELPSAALNLERTAGLRKALIDLGAISKEQYRFNNSSLLNDLNVLSDKANLDEVEKQVFKLLNRSLVDKVNEIKKQTDPASIKTEWKNEFYITDTPKKIILVISRIDKDNNLVRDGGRDKEFQLEVGSVLPYYKRATLEIVPVANFIFSNNVREFYVENSLVQSRLKHNITTNAGVVLNINVAHFGPSKEMSVGFGPGYKFSTKGDAFENFYLSTLLSYKNFLRIGFGLGLAQFPTEELKGGVKVGQTLPSNIANVNDLLLYEEKPSAFITIAFTGLNLSKKK